MARFTCATSSNPCERASGGSVTAEMTVDASLPIEPSAEDALRSSEELFHHLVEAVTDFAIYRLDAEGRVLTWSSGARAIKGYTAEEVIGRHVSLFYPAEDVAAGKVERLLATVRRDGRFEEEAFRVRKNGERFRANVVITALRDPRGEVVGFAKVTRDLTAKLRAEGERQRSEERFRLLVDAVSDYAIYMLDPDGRVTTWNSGAERLKGYRAAEIIGRPFSVFFSAEDVEAGRPSAELEAARDHGHFEGQGDRLRKDGSRFRAHVTLTPIRDDAGALSGFAKITRDLTSEREADDIRRKFIEEQAARTAAEAVAHRADEANRIKDEFLATVSHELRTPLNAMVGWLKILERQPLPPGAARALATVQRNALAQTRIVEDILDVSRIITGKLRIEPAAMNLVTVVREAMDVVRPSSHARQLTVELEANEDVPLIGDAERLRQVVWNLLSNAVKFTDAGTVSIRVLSTDDRIELRVTDTGRGIEPEFLPFVFDRFQQADTSITRRVGGLGLGLALVRHIVELHGGTVTVASEGRGRGATFTVSLPRGAAIVQAMREEEEPEAPHVPAPDPSGDTTYDLTGLRLVAVDDEIDARELMFEVLSGAGASVRTAGSAAEAMALVKELLPHAIVSDIGMADEDGYSLMRRIRALPDSEGGRAPSIAVTAYTRREDRVKALTAGYTAFMTKPVDPEELVAAVAALVPRASR